MRSLFACALLVAMLAFSDAILLGLGSEKPVIEYVVDESTGKGYKLVYKAKDWRSARDSCLAEGASLAVPKTQAEFEFLQRIVRGMRYDKVEGASYKKVAYVGINNMENYKTWRNVFGEDINNTGFHSWSGNNGHTYSDDPAEPHCGVVDATNPGYRDWWCHRAQPYVCEITVQ